MTQVKFYMAGQSCFAYFPEIVGDNKGNKTCYFHIGQHSVCSPEYVRRKRLAAPAQYNDLLNELIQQGYDDLEVVNNGRMLSKIITPVNCKYGAPMGRDNIDNRPAVKGMVSDEYINQNPLFDCAVPLNEGYDKGGAYWGTPNNLRVRYSNDLKYIEFYRSK